MLGKETRFPVSHLEIVGSIEGERKCSEDSGSFAEIDAVHRWPMGLSLGKLVPDTDSIGSFRQSTW
jgi:hypothetical protein